MLNYTLQRFLQLIPILFGITFLSFLLMYMAGSDAVTEMYTNRGVRWPKKSSMPEKPSWD